METYTLLFWENVPESSEVYILPDSDLSSEEQRVLETAHLKYVNSLSSSKEEELTLLNIQNAL